MSVLLETDVHVHYGFVWLTAAEDPLPEGHPGPARRRGCAGLQCPGPLDGYGLAHRRRARAGGGAGRRAAAG